MLTHLSLFSGIGGIDLASEWAGFTTVGQCEWADYPTKVLEKHWPNVPRWRDVRDLTAESFRDRTGLSTVDLISGGYPCQPFSVAGSQLGSEDPRYLWPQMLRVVRELRPKWVLGENVAGHISNGLDIVLGDLEREGYTWRTFVVQAQSVGAWHRRERIFVVANTDSEWELQQKGSVQRIRRRIGDGGKDVANTDCPGLQRHGRLCECTGEWTTWQGCRPLEGIWELEPPVGRVATRVSSRVDRLKCLGNAVVPQQVYPILKAIAEIEQRNSKAEE